MNSITDLLDLEDADIFISDISIRDTRKTITLETRPKPCFCPCCGFRMHSRGIKIRSISHPILQDGYELILRLKQRRWRCSNAGCKYETNESFRFVDKNRRATNATNMMIVLAFRDLSLSPAHHKFKLLHEHLCMKKLVLVSNQNFLYSIIQII